MELRLPVPLAPLPNTSFFDALHSSIHDDDDDDDGGDDDDDDAFD